MNNYGDAIHYLLPKTGHWAHLVAAGPGRTESSGGRGDRTMPMIHGYQKQGASA
jgi:hypothetical protein